MSGYRLIAAAALAGGLSAGIGAPAQALTLFTGLDTGATTRAAATQSVAAESAFLAAVSGVQTEDFSATGYGVGDSFSGLSDAQTVISGFTMTTVDPQPDGDLRFADLGYATSGADYVALLENGAEEPAAEAVFSFDTPILGFGLMLSCSFQCDPGAGVGRFVVDGMDYAIALQAPGIMFWGFVSDTPISALSLVIDPVGGGNEVYYGFDDVRAATALAAPVPAPAAAPLLAAGIAGLGLIARRRRRAG